MVPSTFLFFIFHQLTGWLGFKISLLYPIEELELEAWAIRFSDLIFSVENMDLRQVWWHIPMKSNQFLFHMKTLSYNWKQAINK